jgi:putative DNA primase/helicase
VPFTDYWFASNQRRHFEYGLDFDVSAPGNRNGKYNLFKGWKLGKGVASDVAPFLELMKDVISSGNDRDFTILEALIAQMFQEPGEKPSIVIMIRGDKGVGKSFFVEKLSALMDPYSFKTSNPDHVFGDHNGQLKHVLLLHLEEAV